MEFKDTFFSRNPAINCHGNLVGLESPKIMGILNVTPDSFFDGGKYCTQESLSSRVDDIIKKGADIIDVGAFSSRPGSEYISHKEEISRLAPALDYIRNNYPGSIISVDTFSSKTAEKVVREYKVDIINDITGGKGDPAIIDFIAESSTPYVLMHMQGTPKTMQKNPSYKDVVDEVLVFLGERVHFLQSKGVKDIIVDPGFGFGKNLDHNYSLMASLDVFKALERPILVGISRKSMISKLMNIKTEDTLNGTTALNMFALSKGVNILRVHDVQEANEVRSIFNRLKSAENHADK